MDWGAFMKNARVARGFKQGAMAEFLGVDQGTISRWERNASEPTVAMKKTLREKLCCHLNSEDGLADLAERVRNSAEAVLLSRAGTFATEVASAAAKARLRLPEDGTYDWESAPRTKQQDNVYGPVTDYFRLFGDRTITHVEACVAIQLPDGEVRMNHSVYVPIWLGSDAARLIIKPKISIPFEGRSGYLRVIRATEAPEVLEVRNE